MGKVTPDKKKVLIITGPTASGKTSIAIQLAQELGGEIISADSRQVYRFMDIGTAKPTLEERGRAVHYLIDIANPDQTYSAGRFVRDAEDLIEQILNRNKLPIIVGGTGLYIKSLTQGLFRGPAADKTLREGLEDEVKRYGLEILYDRLKKRDPATASRISPKDKIRIVRGLEIVELTSRPISDWQTKETVPACQYDFRGYVIDMDRKKLYSRINQRVENMMELGFVEEVKNLKAGGYDFQLPALCTFGYLDFHRHLEGELKLDEAVANFKQKTRNYAKRQLTWFRSQKQLEWIPAGEVSCGEIIAERFGR
ncbi:MAG: tRNA (adenosine(37)-N6)-dimethylallyltransferase MiaA [candidate division Zixibacteria bacterium]|nr:tRNA (adenosine(37)-N6)-dimethylallyltransferase MiaA [candidate division Zixibacteria bacterium]